jgi:LysR family nitrogen assimilation transcriptional regulator
VLDLSVRVRNLVTTRSNLVRMEAMPVISRASTTYLDLKQLRYFIAVCEAGSISAAAIALGIGQATLSENIATLEKRLDATLFVRGSRGVLLTQSGDVLAKQGRDLQETVKKIVQAVAQSGQSSGPVTLGLPPSLGVLIGIPLAETIHNEFAQIQLHISEGLSGHILDWLANGTVDLGYVYESPNLAAFDVAPVFREELFLIAAADFVPNAAVVVEDGDLSIPIEALGELPFVLPSARHNARRIIDRILRIKNISPTIVSEIDSHSQIVEMLARASAYTILPRAAVLRDLASGTLMAIRVSGAQFVRTCYCVRRRHDTVPAATIVIQRKIADIVREMSRRHALELDFVPQGGG